ncbi:hypothetical protein R3P38DRAFT_2679546 [Favolaschia claudopus]|uniref:F-box domain-containing protein n=1 Tax=Favolaschia claudopus TaxID=2862362 RepID=A0AAW0E8Q4_9AGAR
MVSHRGSSSLRPTSFLLSLPPEILRIICVFMDGLDCSEAFLENTWGEEDCNVSEIVPLSSTCRALRNIIQPWIFRFVYNWNREQEIWPESIWDLIRQVNLRDRQIRNPQPIKLSSALFDALPQLPALTKATLTLDETIPTQLLVALSRAPQLSTLEIHRAKLDSIALSFPKTAFVKLETLIISVWAITIKPTIRTTHGATEVHNVMLLLQCVAPRLQTLKISGDLISSMFLGVAWPRLESFTVTEHIPSPYYPVPRLISHMPLLRELSVLFTADLSQSDSRRHPPFFLGSVNGKQLDALPPGLSSARFSNLTSEDPIFAQLPTTLTGLHIEAAEDLYRPARHNVRSFLEQPLNSTSVFHVLERISRLTDLVELTLTLNHFPTSALINAVADAFPDLEFLELGYPRYMRGEVSPDDLRDQGLLDSLARFPRLRHVRISLDFPRRANDKRQRNSQIRVARWFLTRLPRLQTISFTFHNWLAMAWTWYLPLERTSWMTHTRDVLLLDEPEPDRPRLQRRATPQPPVSE